MYGLRGKRQGANGIWGETTRGERDLGRNDGWNDTTNLVKILLSE